MAVVIRMKRTGRRHRPCYRISVADSRDPRDGTIIETLGLYDPIAPKPEMRLELKVDRAKYWISKGAKPSETVASIFRGADVYAEQAPPKKRDRSGRKKVTATKKTRAANKAKRLENKTQRRTQREQAKQAAKAAAAAPAEA